MIRRMTAHERDVVSTFEELGARVSVAGETIWLVLPGICRVPVSIDTAYEWAMDVSNYVPWEAWLPSAIAKGEGVLSIWQWRPAGMEV